VDTIVSDNGIKTVIESKGDNYFLKNADRMLGLDYIPSDTDFDEMEKYFASNAIATATPEVVEAEAVVTAVLINFSIPSLDISKLLKAPDNENPVEILDRLRTKPGVTMEENTTYICWKICQGSPPQFMENNKPIRIYNLQKGDIVQVLKQGENPGNFSVKKFHVEPTPTNQTNQTNSTPTKKDKKGRRMTIFGQKKDGKKKK